MDVKSREPVSATTVFAELEAAEERNDVQELTLEHLTKNLAVQDPDTLDELMEELDEIESLRDEHRLKIVETLPRSEMEVQALFSKERIKLDDDEIDRIVDFSESVGKR